MFTVIYSRGYFPKSGSLGDMSLHKKGNKDNVQNYRGITVLNVLGKLFTRILDIRLATWTENYGVDIEAYAGFRQHMCTGDNIFVLKNLISHALNSGRRKPKTLTLMYQTVNKGAPSYLTHLLLCRVVFTWLSLVMSVMVSFCSVLFPTRCLG